MAHVSDRQQKGIYVYHSLSRKINKSYKC